jgi:hypothetical protein
VEQVAQCPPGLACREGGEYFTHSWLEQTAGEPLRDSVARGTFAAVYSEREGQRRQIGYCGEPPAASSGSRSALRLPDRIGSAAKGTQAADDISVEQAAELQNFAAAQLDQERVLALAWSVEAGVPLHLGACEGLEQRVAALFPGGSQPGQRLWVERTSVNVP